MDRLPKKGRATTGYTTVFVVVGIQSYCAVPSFFKEKKKRKIPGAKSRWFHQNVHNAVYVTSFYAWKVNEKCKNLPTNKGVFLLKRWREQKLHSAYFSWMCFSHNTLNFGLHILQTLFLKVQYFGKSIALRQQLWHFSASLS